MYYHYIWEEDQFGITLSFNGEVLVTVIELCNQECQLYTTGSGVFNIRVD